MNPLFQYKINATLHEGVETIVYRGQTPISQSIILKLLKAEYPSLEAITRLKHEYQIRENLNHPNIVKVLGIETFNNRLALLLEDFGGVSLTQLIKTEKLPIVTCLGIAIKLVRALDYLHQNRIIHKDIKSSNIIINLQAEIVKLNDFGIASRLSQESPLFNNFNSVEGTLAYMSPEQTGRMNRTLDYRTDFYSLGVTFYEMLTGQLPFQSNDALEIVYDHIAKLAIAPQQLNSEIPATVSEIVMKLMAKNAEDRYQSTAGLVADLEICFKQLTTTGYIADFKTGSVDISNRLLIPQKLYGRETSVNLLLAAFERVSQGTRELMLVSGYSGIGKSAVINEVNKPITRQRGYFIKGKFDQFKRNIPYASLTEAIGSLMRQLLTESTSKLQEWQNKILRALGSNGQVIIDIIPDVELIIGKQPDVPQLSPTESENRFNRVFQQFIKVFTNKEHPLVIFLDDLQWTDLATLKLMQLLITDPDSGYLLFIGAYRDNEVSMAHPLIQTINEIKKSHTVVNNIVLQSLTFNDLKQLIVDTLNQTEQVKPLVESCLTITGGNPFFLTQLLQTLYQENILQFSFPTLNTGDDRKDTKGSWQWDLDAIQAVTIADQGVVELIVRRIQKLPKSTIKVLKLAACVGAQFNLDVLTIVNEESLNATAIDLYSALQAGLILPLSEDYKIALVFDATALNTEKTIKFQRPHLKTEIAKVGFKFLHDRVQQAAYSLIPELQKKETHLRIGQLLLEAIPESEIEESIFQIVNQLNIAVELITQFREKMQLIYLNLIAARKAKNATAYESALRYLIVGLRLLTEDSWLINYDLTLDLYLEAIEVEYLNANYQSAKALIDLAIDQAKTDLDKVKIYEKKIQFYTSQGDFKTAIDTGLEILALLGFPLPKNSDELSKISTELRSELTIEASKIVELIDLPLMNDEIKLATSRILVTLIPPVYFEKPELLFPVILSLVSLAVNYGNAASSAYGYCLYGLLLCGALGDITAGYEYGQLSLKVIDQFSNDPIKCQVYKVFASHIQPWKEPLRAAMKNFLISIQIGLETGNAEYTGYGSAEYCLYLFLSGENLEVVEQSSAPYEEILKNLKQEFGIFYLKIGRQVALNFAGKTLNPCHLTGDSFQEETMLPIMVKANYRMLIFCFHLCKLMLFYFFKEYEQAIVQANLSLTLLDAVVGTIFVAERSFYHSLSLLAQYPLLTEIDQQESLKIVELNQENLLNWATHAPMNFQHKYDLVEAEKARVLGQTFKAMEYYDCAILGAGEQGYLQEEALANELASKFYLLCGRDKISRLYLRDAYYGYIRWGAFAKVKDLENEHSFLIVQAKDTELAKPDLTNTKTGSNSVNNFSTSLDFATFIKLSQAITSEICLKNLLKKLVKILLENAAAQKAVVLLHKEEQLYIEAIGTSIDKAVTVLKSIPPTIENLPVLIVNYVFRSQENLILSDATVTEPFNMYPYIQKFQPKSILCLPIFYQSKVQGIIYLENKLTAGAFTQERVEVLQILVSQVAVALENAFLYEHLEAANQQLKNYSQTLEEKVEQRTNALQAAQKQIIAKEKLSSLGALTAGVAHELRNPLNFVNNYAESSVELTQELIEEIDNQVEHLHPDTLDYIKQILIDIKDNATAIYKHGQRAEGIINSMMQHARTETSLRQSTDINVLLDQAVQLAYQSRRANDSDFNAIISKDYDGELMPFEVVSSDLNRAFINIIDNACYAIRLKQKKYEQELDDEQNFFSPMLSIKTKKMAESVEICIGDNGIGIPPEVIDKIFHPFFTTKPTGEGTGLGLSLTHDIIVGQHGGTLQVETELGAFTEFVITLPKA